MGLCHQVRVVTGGGRCARSPNPFQPPHVLRAPGPPLPQLPPHRMSPKQAGNLSPTPKGPPLTQPATGRRHHAAPTPRPSKGLARHQAPHQEGRAPQRSSLHPSRAVGLRPPQRVHVRVRPPALPVRGRFRGRVVRRRCPHLRLARRAGRGLRPITAAVRRRRGVAASAQGPGGGVVGAGGGMGARRPAVQARRLGVLPARPAVALPRRPARLPAPAASPAHGAPPCTAVAGLASNRRPRPRPRRRRRRRPGRALAARPGPRGLGLLVAGGPRARRRPSGPPPAHWLPVSGGGRPAARRYRPGLLRFP
jgi:hypothetical protein